MKYIIGFFLLVLFLRLGLFYFLPLQLQNGQQITFSATVTDDPKVVGSTQQIPLTIGTLWQSKKVLIITKADSPYSYGQTLEVIGTAKNKLLKNKKIVTVIQNPQIKAKNEGFLPFFGSLRQKAIDFCENNFSQPYSGLLIGIIFGIKNLITNQITISFQITGLSHLLVVDGLKMTLVAGFLFQLFSKLLKRKRSLICSLVGISLYVCLSGFQASILRAAFMSGIAFSASLFGRQYVPLYALFLVTAGLLLWNPLFLMDAGFQLSVLATAGILLLKPALFSHSFFSEDLGITLAAQTATLPIILTTFGTYSLISILANLLVLWTIPLIMVGGAIGIFIGLLFEPLGKFLVNLVIPLLWYLQNTATFFSIHSLTLEITTIPLVLILGYYLFLVGLVLWRNNKI